MVGTKTIFMHWEARSVISKYNELANVKLNMTALTRVQHSKSAHDFKMLCTPTTDFPKPYLRDFIVAAYVMRVESRTSKM